MKALEDNTKDKKKLENLVQNLDKNSLEIKKLEEKDKEKDKILEEKNKEIEEIFAKLAKAEQDLKTLNETLTKSEIFINETKNNYSDLLARCKLLEESYKRLENTNSDLNEQISRLNDELKKKIEETEALSKEIERVRREELISFKVNLNVKDENEEILNIKNDYFKLENYLKNTKKLLEAEIQENQKNYEEKENLEKISKILTEKLENFEKNFETEKESFKEKLLIKKSQIKKITKYCSELEENIKKNNSQIKDLETQFFAKNSEFLLRDHRILELSEDLKSLSELLAQLKSEKSNLDSQNRQKDLKIKNLSSKLSFYESQIQEKNKEILIKENELMNADRQMELLKKKLNSSSTRIKQIAFEQIDSQKKKIENYESEISMLKEMIKSIQSELKYKQQEILNIKKKSPKKDPVFESPQLLKIVKEKEIKQDLLKDSPFKKNSFNIFKVKSPFKIASTKDLIQEDIPNILKSIIKGYLTSYVLFEKEKKELLLSFQEEDTNNRGVLDKNIVLEKCEEVVIDTSLLNMYGNEVDYKDFIDIHYHNQLQQIHRDLDANFSQILPGSISVSELKLIKQALRPLHRQIWDVIISRIIAEYPKEVDLFVLRQVLLQINISV